MKRREFIGMAIAAGATATIAPMWAAIEAEPLSVLAIPHVLGVLHDRQIVHELGIRYRKLTPDESTTESLRQAILRDIGPIATTSLEAQIRARVQHDFAIGRTLTLDGWILSRIEARQCALYSLLAT